ncbi:MAG: D-alanyl-D-alanine carboxypeptidase/D-alanyl-D-alanine-endopeptidase [Burkholderiales bacterium]|nr:MAG: D-alanyl-D-alanine carboxypeptidase/D-alanyl-D-alanine-endopeptidase [Burkholderiales bacterium]
MRLFDLPRLFLLSLGLFAIHGHAQPLPKEVLQGLARAGVPTSAISVVVQTIPSAASATATLEAPVIKHRAEVGVNPASVMKLITTYAALDQLGADFTWKNRVYIDGTLEGGVLQGHLILRGSGDPKFVLERIEELFAQVRAKGVREVRGDIVLDRRVFDVPDKNPADFDDEPLRPYNAVPDGLLVNFKSLIFNFSPDVTNKRVLLRVDPPISRVEFPAEISASYGACGDWRGSLQGDFSNPDRVTFSGRYAISCGERVWPVAYVAPRQYAARVIEAMWRKSGGGLTGTVREDALPRTARLLHTEPSLPLSDIIADVNKFSNNVMAQQVFLTLSSELPTTGRTGSFAASRRNVAAWWKKNLPGIPEPVLDNGSGLSRQERASAASINSLLQLAASSTQALVFANSMGIAGVDGTVARMRDRNAASAAIGQAQLKTGTLRDVAAVAGYASALSGQRYSLAAIINHPNAGAARPALDALVEWVVKRP